MKISTKPCVKEPPFILDGALAGQVVKFFKTFHDYHSKDDLFIVTAVCNSYVPECIKRSSDYPHDHDRYAPARNSAYVPRGCKPGGFNGFGKVALTNLVNGKLCYVRGNTKCELIDAEVCVS